MEALQEAAMVDAAAVWRELGVYTVDAAPAAGVLAAATAVTNTRGAAAARGGRGGRGDGGGAFGGCDRRSRRTGRRRRYVWGGRGTGTKGGRVGGAQVGHHSHWCRQGPRGGGKSTASLFQSDPLALWRHLHDGVDQPPGAVSGSPPTVARAVSGASAGPQRGVRGARAGRQ